MMKRVLLTLVLTLVALIATSQSVLLESGWQSQTGDSVPPLATYQFKLGSYSTQIQYSARIEYPELLPVSEEQLLVWGIEKNSLPSWPDISCSLGLSRGNAVLDVAFIPLIQRDGKAFVIDSYKLELVTTKGSRSFLAASGPMRYVHESVLSSGRWVKVRVASSGVYGFSYSRLRELGFADPSKVKVYGYGGKQLPESKLQNMIDDLPSQPVWNDGARILFYAQGPEDVSYSGGYLVHSVNYYSDYGCYFLTDRADIPEDSYVSPSECDSVIGNLICTYSDCEFLDKDEFSWMMSGRRQFEKADFASAGSRTYDFNTKNMVAGKAYLRVSFSTNSTKSSLLDVQVDGTSAGVMPLDAVIGSNVASVAEKTFSLNLQEKQNLKVRLKYSSQTACESHLDYLRLEFTRRTAMGSSAFFRVPLKSDCKGASLCVTQSNESVLIWKIEAGGKATVMPSVFRNDSTIAYASDLNTSDILLAVNPRASFPEPFIAESIVNQNLHGVGPLDFVIIVPASGKIIPQAERLAQAHRDVDKLKVGVFRADQVYNEFSSGTPDATAIRRFMKMLYDRADGGTSAPRYLLLMGAGTYDNRMHTSDMKGRNPDDYLLCFESDNSLNSTGSYVMEDYFGLLDDNEGVNLLTEKTDVGVGRLPVEDNHQAKVAVDRIIGYMTGANAGRWLNEILVLGDDGDNNTHMKDADDVAELYGDLYPDKRITKMYWDSYPMEAQASYNSYPSLRKRLLEKLDEGALIVNYTGHGSVEVMSHELVMSKADAAELASPRLPFWITASCDMAPFDQPLVNFGCNLLSNEKGGAIGMLSTTRTVVSYQNRLMNLCFSKYVLAADANDNAYALGDALMLAKNELVTDGGMTDKSANKLNFVLLADPALKLHRSAYTAVIDSFADASPTQCCLEAKAGEIVTVKGHIESDGILRQDFNGLLYSTVYDNEREVTCFNNLNAADEPFKYNARDRIISMGTDSVRSGVFQFSFPVPLDINYSSENGLINLFALSENRESSASGTFADFIVGGTASGIWNDTEGPSIGLYLNSPAFQYGASVDKTPLLVIDLHDESGLNTTGNGLGHEIVLTIDGNRSKTWVLDSYYVQQEGSFTDGRIMFRIPELSEGKHMLSVRAWDTMNNSSTAYLEFKVVDGLEPSFDIYVTESPAREHTCFVISHDRPMQNAVVSVSIINGNGEVEWGHNEIDESQTGISYIDWNLCNTAGIRVPTGLYLVRATVAAEGQQHSVSCKMVVLNP